ncbi:heavy-metal-associated domain-containing protein [Fretibacterium sp. OH1220_COT-178]|uniref:heavy-metal-associated domain-containing protein n=1 Tax=Fretibacterium sp. OH1220_COT-178 TaxID=2491047 RepID=UPI001315052D|nr:heavy-metal-associated domain-containing protein [Fretibacterium sp. OH1220_COT-178]
MKKTLGVADMACQHCVGRIEKALKAAGVTDYEIVLEAKEVRVAESQAALAASALSEAGYPCVPKD